MNTTATTTSSDQTDLPFKREYLAGILQEGKVTVTFTKLDGTTRVMNCTMSESLIPQELMPKAPSLDAPPRKVSMDTLRVFDLDINEWRSFRVDSVKEFSFTIQ
jgi:hypothetical protein